MQNVFRFGVSGIALMVAACGGGGGGTNTSGSKPPPTTPQGPVALPSEMPPPATTPTNENLNTDEYRRSSAAIGSNAIGAWQQGATGRGITIGFVDTGLDPSLPDFAGRLDPQSKDVAGSRSMGDTYGHGTAVAGIAAGGRNSWGIQGIAYEATIFMARADHGCPSSCGFYNEDIAQGIDAARIAGARVINLSIGGQVNDDVSDAVRRAVSAGIILVVAAGNEGTAPSGTAQTLASISSTNVIIVGALGATNPDGTINYDVPGKWTTPAAGNANSFLTAPGWLNGGTNAPSASGYDLFSGTSFAAPVVAGALALLAQAFPTLTPQQLVALLYVTADDLGATGVDTTFGRGRLNIGRAFQPVGEVRMAGTDRQLSAYEGTVLPAAAGDAALRSGIKSVVLDSFNRAFDFNLAATFKKRAELGPLARSLSGQNQTTVTQAGPFSLAMTVSGNRHGGSVTDKLGLSRDEQEMSRTLATMVIARLNATSSMAFGFRTGSSALLDELSGASPRGSFLTASADEAGGLMGQNVRSLAFRQMLNGVGITLSGETGSVTVDANERSKYSMATASIDAGSRKAAFRASVSRMVESETVLGGAFPASFGSRGSQTWFASANIRGQLGDSWEWSAIYRRGWTSGSVGRFRTSAFSVNMARSNLFSSSDRIALKVSQPLRVERGDIELLLPSSWNYYSELSTNSLQRFSLTPSGRELDAEASYSMPIPRGWMSLNLFGRANPGHARHAAPDVGIAFRINTKLGGH